MHFTKCPSPFPKYGEGCYTIERTPGAPMTDEKSSYVYLTHEEMLEIAAQREAANEQAEETTKQDETK